MSDQSDHTPVNDRFDALFTRRTVLRKGAVVLCGVLVPAVFRKGEAVGAISPPPIYRPRDPEHLTEFEKIHVPQIRMADVITDGANAPIIVEMDHPMEPEHYIRSVQILDYHDPIIWKGTFSFTPVNGSVYLYSQLRLDSGKSVVYVIAECNKHGKWVAGHEVDIAVGGC